MRLSHVFAAMLALGLALPASAQQGSGGEGGTLRVHIISLRSDQGNIGCLLFRGARGFPNEPDRAVSKVVGQLGRTNRRTATCTFRNIPAGRYAVAVGHDENGNQRMDTNAVGIPTEGWGTSRDAPARFGPPAYEDAVFEFDGRRKLVLATMRYGF